jgi:hypothetical protein
MPLHFFTRFLLLGLLVATPLSSAVIGTSKPAESITAAQQAFDAYTAWSKTHGGGTAQ